jgi:prolipoprotein diacylglyceryltransferase/protein-S-isoprenylcysteine O-methyltransferase Ste14
MNNETHPIGKILYGSLFVLLVPVWLVLWAVFSEANVSLPGFQSVAGGIVLSIAGLLLMGSGMVALRTYGHGLPMNAYPPPDLVSQGIYRWHSHPIYLGFVFLSCGVSLWTGSASGLWLVSPVVAASAAALVLGYESIDLRRRFGKLPRPLLSLPPDVGDAPRAVERWMVSLGVLGLWLALYEMLALIPVPEGAVVAYLPFEDKWPVLQWTEPIYAATYILVALVPFVAPTRSSLRRFAIRGWVANGLMVLFFIAVPLVAPPRAFAPTSIFGELLQFERTLDTYANAFPSYHVIWIVLSMGVYAERFPRFRWFWYVVGGAVVASCMTTGQHALVDVLAGILVGAALLRVDRIWQNLRRFTERIANSWHEWQWGRVRLINHGLYAGIGSFLAVLIVGTLLGPGELTATLFVAFSALVMSALWAQIVEGSPSLLRPYGYYGGVLGIIVGSLMAWPLFGTDPWLLLAGYSVAGPWVQSWGRVRCLVQGCCHGSEAPASLGIVYRHPRTRVVRLSEFAGVPLHPTPLYSILWNVVIAVIMARLWMQCAPLSVIGGLYLIMTGVGRFVEEAYRGEPQTHTMGGLRFYQWIAICTLLAGTVVTCVGSDSAPAIVAPGAGILLGAAVFGLLTWGALGVDFPSSNRRFARLA